MIAMTLAGNSTSAGAGYILMSSGTVTLAGGTNVTLSQNGNAVTISGPNMFTGGASSGGNTAGTTGTVSNGVLFFGGANITLSESSAAGGATVSIIGGAGAAFSGGVSTNGNTDGTTGTVGNGILFVGGTNITLSQSTAAGGATITINAPPSVLPPAPFEGGVSNLGNTLGDTGTVTSQIVFAGGSNITLSQVTGAGGATITVLGPANQTGISGIAASGASTAVSGTVQFANSNGLTFGLNGNTITGSYSIYNFADQEIPSGAFNGTNTLYTLANAPNPAACLMLFVNGQNLISSFDYTLSSVSLSLAAPPITNDRVRAWYRY